MVKTLLLSIAFVFAQVVSATAEIDHHVSTAAAFKRAVKSAKSGAVIEIAEGRYDLQDVKIPRDLTLIGRGEVVFFSSQSVSKGILNPLSGASLFVENIDFHSATSPDKNGAGIRHDGNNLTVVNCTFEDNENGILSTGAENGQIRIRGSAFLRNGFGDGYSHGVYVVRAASLVVSESEFAGTKIGHHVKSLADRTRITDSTLDDADGRTSYTVDASRGGDVLIMNNTIIQSSNGDNAIIVNYDLSRGGSATALAIFDNRIVNRHPQGRLLRNATKLAPAISGNDTRNEAGGRLIGQ